MVFRVSVVAHWRQCKGIWIIGNCALATMHGNMVHWQLHPSDKRLTIVHQ